jgi:AcrR family transcriptional regulator
MVEGLRERKKREARQRISDVATRLFAERGFEAVTVAEIAEAADVAKATVTNYFPRKEDLLLDMQAEAERLLLDAIRNRPAGQPVIEAVRALMHRLLERQHPLSAAAPEIAWFGKLVAESPALLARAREQREYLETAVTRQLTEAELVLDRVHADLIARLLLATASTVVVTAYRRLLSGNPAHVVVQDQKVVIDHAYGSDELEPPPGNR